MIARSKTAYWERRLSDAAEYARRGYDYAPSGTARALLACQEADAWQELGDIARAREALQRAQRVTDETHGQPEELGGLFACGPARRSNYAVAVHIRAADPVRALAEADRARRAWESGDQWAYGTWATTQIRTGLAYLISGQIDGTKEALRPVLDLPPERRLSTITALLDKDVRAHLNQPRLRGSLEAEPLLDEIETYCSSSVAVRALPKGSPS